MSDRLPTVTGDLTGWERVEATTETVFQLPTARVQGHTVVYEDVELGAAVQREAGGDGARDHDLGDDDHDADPDDHDDGPDNHDDGPDDDADGPWRFLFATRLTFRPPLAPGIGPASVYPTVAAEAASAFGDRLRDRGFEDVDRERGQRMRVDSGDRARLWKYTARFESPLGTVDVEGWTALWIADGEFLLAGGAYPRRGLASILGDDDLDPGRFRDETLALIRSVE